MCFYVVSTYEFFCTIELRSNSLYPPSTSNLLLPPDNHNSQDHRSTDHKKQFFSMQEQKKVPSRQLPLLLRPAPSHHVDCYDQSAVASVTSTTRSLEHVLVLRPAPSRRLQLKRERERGTKKIHAFFLC